MSHRYASALFDLAKEENALPAVEKDVATLKALLEASADLRRLFGSPVFSIEDQVRALDAVLKHAEVGGLVANFMRVVARNRRLFAAPAMLEIFGEIAAQDRGETVAVVTSAEPLSETQLTALREALAEKAGGTVKLETKVDPSLIGGLVVKLGSQMIDTSVKTRLASLKTAMRSAA